MYVRAVHAGSKLLLGLVLICTWQVGLHALMNCHLPGTRILRDIYYYREHINRPIWVGFDVILPTSAICALITWRLWDWPWWARWLGAIVMVGTVVLLFPIYAWIGGPGEPHWWPAMSEQQVALMRQGYRDVEILTTAIIVSTAPVLPGWRKRANEIQDERRIKKAERSEPR